MANSVPEFEIPSLPLRLGISTCLLGEQVRFDGGHKRDRYITDVLAQYFEFVPVCPELEVGMGVPREAVRLVGNPERPRMIGISSEDDWTDRMNRYSAQRVRELDGLQLSGFLFKKDSPSCGIERVRVYGGSGMPSRIGRGLFATAFIEHFPLIPVEEEGRLNDPSLRENFIVRVFAYHRLQHLIHQGFRRGALVRFHTVHKYLLLAHSPKHSSPLGRLVANSKEHRSKRFQQEYSRLFMEALRMKSTTKKNVNVLQHVMGFLSDYVSAGEKRDIFSVIEDYRRELVPLVVPITLVGHYVRKHDIEYIRDQIYLNPHPKELMLRNHV